ncbi:MAG TPA: hypothetical protein VEC57_01715 [Candidatus Limnocylindrales bacterium]|nr:hypothetical protein [Candidatus Limnocylindrales bacterium]
MTGPSPLPCHQRTDENVVMESWPVFVACAPGLEPLLNAEITSIGGDATASSIVEGGVELHADAATLYRLHLELGLALKILVRIGTFRATGFGELERRAAALPWERWLTPPVSVLVRATCRHSRLWHSDAVAERVQGVIAEWAVASAATPCRRGRRARRRGGAESDAPAGTTGVAMANALEVQVRLMDDVCTISLDTAGELLSRRGYREAGAKAPLREDLARALVIASGWDMRSPLVDPFAGSGTIAIEADWLARRVPPGHLRRFALFEMPAFDPRLWSELRDAALQRSTIEGPPIFASDRDAGAVKAARANAERATCNNVHVDEAALMSAPALAAPPAERGAIVTNPPWGRRVRGRDPLANLYAAFGNAARKLPGSWRVAMAVASPQLARMTGLDLQPAVMTDSGGVKVYFAVGAAHALPPRRRRPARRPSRPRQGTR